MTLRRQRLLGLESISGLWDIVVSLDRCRLRRGVLTLIDMFGYKIERRIGPSSVNSGCSCVDPREEGLRSGRGAAVGVFVDVSRDGCSLGVVGSRAGE